MEDGMKAETARRAAKYWADFIRSGSAPLDNGDNSPTGGMTFVLAKMLQASSPKHYSEADAFEKALAARLERLDGNHVYIGVDYHPDETLQGAASDAGIALGMTDLPWKTSMRISDDRVLVRQGYCAEEREL
jgi:hypothetical protein